LGDKVLNYDDRGGIAMKSPENLKNNLIDPVCGMAVDPKHANAFATLEGSTYYFCAEGCRKAFEANPESI